jgi:UDP-galactopyranose mutase
VLVAEVVKHFMPCLVDLHNYSPAHSFVQKLTNWNTLNSNANAVKAFRRIGFAIERADVEKVIRCEPEAAERVLELIKAKIEAHYTRKQQASQAEAEAKLIAEMPVEAPVAEKTVEEGFEPLPEDKIIAELRETVEIMELKVKKLEQLVKLKEAKITVLSNKLAAQR